MRGSRRDLVRYGVPGGSPASTMNECAPRLSGINFRNLALGWLLAVLGTFVLAVTDAPTGAVVTVYGALAALMLVIVPRYPHRHSAPVGELPDLLDQVETRIAREVAPRPPLRQTPPVHDDPKFAPDLFEPGRPALRQIQRERNALSRSMEQARTSTKTSQPVTPNATRDVKTGGYRASTTASGGGIRASNTVPRAGKPKRHGITGFGKSKGYNLVSGSKFKRLGKKRPQ